MGLPVLVHQRNENRKIHYLAVFLFLHYTLRMQKVINESVQHVFLSGENE